EAVTAQKDLKIVYSSIHVTGVTVVPKMLEAWGFENIISVAEQSKRDGNFPTVVYPNPEEEEAMSIALQKGIEVGADVIMATDPDADRVGVAVKNAQGDYQQLNGNQIGSLLTYYILSSKKDRKELQEKDYTVKTIVTTNLMSDISNDVEVKCYDTLTGFKYIGEMISNLLGQERYLVGGEESYGFLVGDLVRDKDAVNSCAFIAEMTAYFKDEAKTLFDVLLELYVRYGFYKEKLISLTKKGKAGADEIKQMMHNLRTDTPKSLGGVQVQKVRDYKNQQEINLISGEKSTIDLPASDVLQFITVDGDVISVRPSGTEPKIKFYCSVKETLIDASRYQEISQKLDKKVTSIMADIVKD